MAKSIELQGSWQKPLNTVTDDQLLAKKHKWKKLPSSGRLQRMRDAVKGDGAVSDVIASNKVEREYKKQSWADMCDELSDSESDDDDNE